jgi:hypothetical protein
MPSEEDDGSMTEAITSDGAPGSPFWCARAWIMQHIRWQAASARMSDENGALRSMTSAMIDWNRRTSKL